MLKAKPKLKRGAGSLERVVSTPFWQRGLETLQQIAREPVAPADELRMLKRQLESAIEMVERGDLVPMSERERIEHASRFGVGAFVIGDFVITRRRSANDKVSDRPR